MARASTLMGYRVYNEPMFDEFLRPHSVVSMILLSERPQKEATMENQEQEAPTASAAGEPSTNGASKPKREKTRPKRYLPSDRIAFTKQLQLLRAYGAMSGAGGTPVKNREAADMLKMSESTVTLMNPFFTDTVLLRRSDRGFIPAEEVLNFARAHEWNPQTAAAKLKPLLARSWFGEALLPRVSFDPISEEDALSTLADAVGATSEYKPQLRLLLDYLDAGGVIERDGTMIKKGRGAASLVTASEPDSQTSEEPTVEAKPEKNEAPEPTTTSVVTAFSQPTEGTVQFHVSVKVDMAEFAGWDPQRITAFFGGIAQVLAAKGAIEKEVSSK